MTPNTLAPFTLAHLSDPHLPPLPKPRLIELAGKRALGYVNWTRNRHKYQRREVLDALVADMKAQSPDHVAVTGDLVNLALEAEFAPALAWLESVGPPERVTAIPATTTPTSVPPLIVSARRLRPILPATTAASVFRPCAGADRCVDQPVHGGTDPAADGDRHAPGPISSPRSNRCSNGSRRRTSSACCWCIIR